MEMFPMSTLRNLSTFQVRAIYVIIIIIILIVITFVNLILNNLLNFTVPLAGHRMPTAPTYSISHFEAKKKDKKKSKNDKKKKFCKEDISLPTNFQHIHHVGLNLEGNDVRDCFN
jgi:hypothetical protein